MSLESTVSIDAIGIDNESQSIILTIADSWDWNDEQFHLLALQEKINSYFEFVESGQVWESCPTEIGRQIVIDVVGRFPLPKSAIEFLTLADSTAGKLNVIVRHRMV